MTEKRSTWQVDSAGQNRKQTQPLTQDLNIDVCVIGASIAGLLCALELAERGRSVVLLERDAIASGDTGMTTAHLTALLDTRYFALAKMHGVEAARTVAASHIRGIAHIERVANSHVIDCGFRRVSGFLCASNEAQAEQLRREGAAATEAGISCELVRRAPLANLGPALHVPYQAEIDPLAFVAGVVDALERLGVLIYAPVTVQEFDPASASDQVGLRTSDGRSIRASQVIVATSTPINDVTVLHTKQAAYRTYAIAAEIAEQEAALCWDLEDPYHYVRTALDARSRRPVLIVGGEDHRVGQDLDATQHWSRLEDWLREHFPAAGAVVNQWSGQVIETSDGLAYIGKNPGQERVFVVTGTSGNGFTYAALAAEVIADLIEGKDNRFAEIYDPARKPSSLSAIATFVRENLNTAEQYTDWLGPSDIAKVEDIPNGEGAVLRRGLTRVAVYVDDVGLSHELSATCPHLGGVVAWNPAEKSWDCPCHGSRFDCYGKVLAGPAVSDLKPVSSVTRKVGKAS